MRQLPLKKKLPKPEAFFILFFLSAKRFFFYSPQGVSIAKRLYRRSRLYSPQGVSLAKRVLRRSRVY